MNEYQSALAALKQAEQNFNNAEPEFIDIAVEELRIAQARVDLAVRKEKVGA